MDVQSDGTNLGLLFGAKEIQCGRQFVAVVAHTVNTVLQNNRLRILKNISPGMLGLRFILFVVSFEV